MELLDRANEEIAKYVRRTKGVYTKARYKEIAKKLREISKALREKVGSGIDIDGVIGYELRKQEKLLDLLKGDIVKVKGGEVNFLFPSTEQIKTAALFKPVTEGFTYDSYLNGIQEGLYNVWDSAVRTGYLTGQTTQQIVRNVMGGISPETKLRNPGMIDRLRNSVQANTRTVLQSFAHETRSRVYAENEKYFGDGETEYKYEWLSTLDNRTCIACGELDGRLFRTLEEVPQIPLHTGCVTGDAFVSSVGRITKVYRRRYKGLLYRITTASGNVLTVTPNHPVLTDKGFVRAHLLNVGDDVICDNGLKAIGIVCENENDREATIKDVFRSFRKSPSVSSCSVPVTAEDFHGDAVYNKVDVVSSDGELSGKGNVSGFKFVGKNPFINGNLAAALENEPHKRGVLQILRSHFPALGNLVRVLGKLGDLLWSGMTHPLNLLFTWVPLGNVVPPEKADHGTSSVAEPFGDSGNSDPLIVKLKNLINRKIVGRAFAACVNSRLEQDVPDDVFGTTVLAGDVLDRYSASISPDNIVAVDVIFSFTHVYNLETENNWYVANGIITHNCRCVLLPYFDIKGGTRASPEGYLDDDTDFETWLRDQDEKTQLDVLGRTRYEMFRDGTPMKQFVDGGRVLTLKELEERI